MNVRGEIYYARKSPKTRSISPTSYHDWNELAADISPWIISMNSFTIIFHDCHVFRLVRALTNNSGLAVHHPPTKLTIFPTHPEYHMCDTVLRYHSARCTGVFLRWVRDSRDQQYGNSAADLVGRSPQTCRSRGHRPPLIPAPTKKIGIDITTAILRKLIDFSKCVWRVTA